MKKTIYNPIKLHPARLPWLIALQLALPAIAVAQDYFNPALLQINGPQINNVDLSTFENSGGQLPGTYRVDIVLNQQTVGSHLVTFSKATPSAELQPCLSVAELASYGVRVAQFPALKSAEAKCADLTAIPQASAHLLFNQQQLVLNIPQAAIAHLPRGYVSPSQWDDGITALLLNYNLSAANNYARREGKDSNSQYANLRPGLNIGAWRLRNYTTWSRDSSNGNDKWDTVYTYAQRSIAALRSQLTLGDSNAPSDIFDSLPFRGAQLASDDDMLPDSLRGYAPVVRGIARTNAQVVVRQNGYEIYRDYVAAGAFEINDMYPTGGSGDLNVTVKEADGSEQHFVVPFASLPVLQREGRLKYSVTGGRYRSYDSRVDDSWLIQGTAIYGLPGNITLYGGVQAADHYRSAALGMGNNLGDLGAFSLDVTQSDGQQQFASHRSGQSWRMRYSKNMEQTGTNFAIAGYRYSTSGYYTLQEVLDSWRHGNNSLWLVERRRNRAELTMNQRLWRDSGSLSMSLAHETYWDNDRSMTSLSLAYSNTWHGVSYSVNWSNNRNTQRGGGTNEQQIALNINLPLTLWGNNSTWTSYGLNSTKGGATSQSLGLSGMALRDNSLNWAVQQSYGNRGQGNGGNVNLDYKGGYGEATASYGYDRNTQRINYGLQGSIVAHRHGITFGQPLGETAALVAVPGASDVSVNNQTGVRTDWRGYALVPYLTPYRQTALSLNMETLPADVDISQSSRSLIPTRGALVQTRFIARSGSRVLMALKQANGQPVPFGASAIDRSQQPAQVSIVADGGQVYLSGLSPQGQVLVTWGSGSQCRVNYQLPANAPEMGVIQIDEVCR